MCRGSSLQWGMWRWCQPRWTWTRWCPTGAARAASVSRPAALRGVDKPYDLVCTAHNPHQPPTDALFLDHTVIAKGCILRPSYSFRVDIKCSCTSKSHLPLMLPMTLFLPFSGYVTFTRQLWNSTECCCRIPMVVVDFDLCLPPHTTHLPSSPRAIIYCSPEEEIARGPACWLWDYLRRSGIDPPPLLTLLMGLPPPR